MIYRDFMIRNVYKLITFPPQMGVRTRSRFAVFSALSAASTVTPATLVTQRAWRARILTRYQISSSLEPTLEKMLAGTSLRESLGKEMRSGDLLLELRGRLGEEMRWISNSLSWGDVMRAIISYTYLICENLADSDPVIIPYKVLSRQFVTLYGITRGSVTYDNGNILYNVYSIVV